MFKWLKRMAFFLLTNVLILATISILLKITGLDQYLYANGGNYQGLLIICFFWGMIGAFISLWMSKFSAKMFYGVKILPSDDPRFSGLVSKVHSFARAAGLNKMPEVGIYNSPELNAFATGPSKNNSLVAVSTGLLEKMSEEEVDGVLAHEVAHIENGDMVTMTLIQGVINAFVMFFAHIITNIITQALRGNDDRGRGGFFGMNFMIYMLVQTALSFLGMFVVAYFSRMREYRADAGGARLAGTNSMVAALSALKRHYNIVDPQSQKQSLDTLKISSHSRFLALLSTHPPLEYRIQALQHIR